MSDDFSVEDVARYWDGNAAAWAEQVRRGADVAREWLNNPAFLAFIGDLHGRRVLDAGCGEGYNTRILARRGARMTGVDLSERMIALAQEEERREPLGIEYGRTSYTDLAMFTDRSFDAVVSFMALMDGPRFSITHPCFLTKGAKWLRDEEGVKLKWMVGNYFESAALGRARVRRAPIRPQRSPGRRRNTVWRIRASAAGATTSRCFSTSARPSRSPRARDSPRAQSVLARQGVQDVDRPPHI